MYDYMRALYHRFDGPVKEITILEQRVDKAHRQLSKNLGKADRKLLLKLVDLESELRDLRCLHSFKSGYKVANGIAQEIQPPYDFAAEDERLACEKIRTEGSEI